VGIVADGRERLERAIGARPGSEREEAAQPVDPGWGRLADVVGRKVRRRDWSPVVRRWLRQASGRGIDHRLYGRSDAAEGDRSAVGEGVHR
jgi:hypothetical protein